MKSGVLITACLVALVSTACSKGGGSSSAADPVIATVGDTSIHQSQVDDMLSKISPRVTEKAGGDIRKTVLQGLVRTRALAIVADGQLNDAEKLHLDAAVQNYRDELLAKVYVQKNIPPQPVTAEMVSQYYSDHKQDYTDPGVISFEYMVTTGKNLKDETLSKVLDAYTKLKNISDWKSYAATLAREKMPVEYKSARMQPKSMNKAMGAQLAKLQPGETSDVIYDDFIYVAKVIKRDPDVVRPLNEVSVEIRKKIAPQKLKKSLSENVDKVLKGMKVEYTK